MSAGRVLSDEYQAGYDAALRELMEWHDRKADQADNATSRTLHLWAADQTRGPQRERGHDV